MNESHHDHEHRDERPSDGKTYWLDSSRNVHLLYYAAIVIAVALTLGDALYHKHTHFDFEGWYGFYGIFGFIAYVCLVLTAKVLRKILMRDEDYYDR